MCCNRLQKTAHMHWLWNVILKASAAMLINPILCENILTSAPDWLMNIIICIVLIRNVWILACLIWSITELEAFHGDLFLGSNPKSLTKADPATHTKLASHSPWLTVTLYCWISNWAVVSRWYNYKETHFELLALCAEYPFGMDLSNIWVAGELRCLDFHVMLP